MVTQTTTKVICKQAQKCQNAGCMHAKEHEHTQNCQGEVCPLICEVVKCS